MIRSKSRGQTDKFLGTLKLLSALEIDKTYFSAYINWGLALYELERYDESIELFNEARKHDKYNSRACINIEIVLRHLKRDTDAELMHREALELLEKSLGFGGLKEGIQKEIVFANNIKDDEGKPIETEHWKTKLLVLNDLSEQIKKDFEESYI